MPTNNNWDNQIAAANSPITLNSGTNGVNLSTDAAATVVSVATGGANKTLTLGSANTTSTTNIHRVLAELIYLRLLKALWLLVPLVEY